MKILACNSNKELAEAISSYIGVKLADATIRKFADGEIFVKINENIRGEDVYIVQSTSPPVNDHLMELLITIDAARRASARRITAVIPYFGYGRQDRKDEGRTSISAKLVANLITSSGANRVVTTDLHAGQIQGFFDIPLDNLFSVNEMIQDMEKITFAKNTLAIVSPDVGGVVRARAFAKRINASLVIIDKRREKAGESEVMNIIGDVDGRTAVLVDDMVDTAGTLCNAARALKSQGACGVVAYITHAVLSGDAVKRIEASDIDEMVVTDTIPLFEEAARCGKIRQLSLDRVLAEAIRRVSNEESVSAMFR